MFQKLISFIIIEDKTGNHILEIRTLFKTFKIKWKKRKR